MKKTIWIDVCNSPQVLICEHLIKVYSNRYDFLVTARELYNTIPLLEQKKINFTKVGSHYGSLNFLKIIGLFSRVFQLFMLLRNENIRLAFSQSSFYSPLVAWILRIPCIYTNDNEHARGNIIAHCFATKVVCPETWSSLSYLKGEKYIYYRGLKEELYINDVVKDRKDGFMDSGEQIQSIFYRPGSWNAQYYSKNSDEYEEKIIELCKSFGPVIILCRDKNQFSYYQKFFSESVGGTTSPIKLVEIITLGLMFFGSGGTMLREVALAGIPSVSTYQGPTLAVDKILINRGLLVSLAGVDESDWSSTTTDFLKKRALSEVSEVEDNIRSEGIAPTLDKVIAELL